MPSSTERDIAIVYLQSEMLYNNENEWFMTTCNKVMTLIRMKEARHQTVYCIIPLIWRIKATLLLEVRVRPSLVRGSVVTERKDKETSGVLVMFFFSFFFNLSTDCMGGLIVQIHTDKCTFLYAYFTSKVY